jgi:DNA-binding XRE family transcriptional regulator
MQFSFLLPYCPFSKLYGALIVKHRPLVYTVYRGEEKMNCQKVGGLIRVLRKEQHLTQKQLADQLNVSDKTISKWECGLGCPDVSLLKELSSILKIDMHELLSGELPERQLVGGNMKNTQFFVCPLCGGMTVTTGNAKLSCCGRTLEPLEPKKAQGDDRLLCETVEDEWYIQSNHPSEKNNYISFLAFATGDQLQILKQYPEWEIHARIPKRGHGKLIWYSTTKGLFYQLL